VLKHDILIVVLNITMKYTIHLSEPVELLVETFKVLI